MYIDRVERVHVNTNIIANLVAVSTNLPEVMNVTAQVEFHGIVRHMLQMPIDTTKIDRYKVYFTFTFVIIVVVSPDKNNVSIELLPVIVEILPVLLLKTEVTQMENGVFGFHTFIPTSNNLHIHMLKRFKRAITIFYNI
jgi:hypothetical protein